MIRAEPYILHLVLHEMMVNLERRRRPELWEVPLLIGGGGGRSVVVACCEASQAMGVQVGMPVRQARRICPAGRWLRAEVEHYAACAAEVAALLQARVPQHEVAALDAFFVDLTGLERFHGVEAFARELGNAVFQLTRLPLRLGLGPNKLLAQVASGQAQPNQLLQWSAAEAMERLAPLSVHALPGVGEATTRQLSQLGVRRIGELQRIPQAVLQQTFGALGQQLYRKARGEDDRPLRPPQTEEQLSDELSFETECDDPAVLQRRLTELLEGLGFRLRQRGLLTGRLGLRLRYGDGETAQRQVVLSPTAGDEALLAAGRPLLAALYQRRLRVRKLGVQLDKLLPGDPQLMLFQSQARQVELYRALDELRSRYGLKVARRASGLEPGSGLADQ